MSPFIVTTTRSCTCQPSECESDGLLYHETGCGVLNVPRGERVSRRAVGTLEDARTTCAGMVWDAPHIATVSDFYALLDEAFNLPESGGTVGPLPDGTVIEVELIGAIDLFNRADLRKGPPYKSVADVIDAYNARQA